MDIIKPSQLKYESVKHHGICPRCGCEFTVDIEIAIGLNWHRMYRNIECLDNFQMLNNEKYFLCRCPECKFSNVKLESCK